MLDLVPLAGSRRVVTDGDRYLDAIGLENFPSPESECEDDGNAETVKWS